MESLPKQVQKEESKKQAPSTTNKQPAKTTQKVNKLPKEESKVPAEESKFDTAPVKTALKPEDSQIFHGSLGNPHWEAPAVTFKSNEVARKGDNYISFSKTEFKDKPEVLKEKVKLLAEMVKTVGDRVISGLIDFCDDDGDGKTLSKQEFCKLMNADYLGAGGFDPNAQMRKGRP